MPPCVGSVGEAYDNAMCESFFLTLEAELLARRRFESRAETRMACFSNIEGGGWSNRHRPLRPGLQVSDRLRAKLDTPVALMPAPAPIPCCVSEPATPLKDAPEARRSRGLRSLTGAAASDKGLPSDQWRIPRQAAKSSTETGQPQLPRAHPRLQPTVQAGVPCQPPPQTSGETCATDLWFR